MSEKKPVPVRVQSLRERAKELNCLYRIERLLAGVSRPLPDIFRDIIATIPSGWQFPQLCRARIEYDGVAYEPAGYTPTEWSDTVSIKEGDHVVGCIEVSYIHALPSPGGELFLKKEHQLLRTIADRIGQTVLQRKLEQLLQEREALSRQSVAERSREWMTIVNLLRRTDEKLFLHISRKMLYHLFWSGIKDARQLLNAFGSEFAEHHAEGSSDANSPIRKQSRESIFSVSDRVFAIAAHHLRDAETSSLLHKWIQEDKLGFLIKAVDSGKASLGAIIDAVLRYQILSNGQSVLDPSTEKRLLVSLIRRFFSNDVEFINVAKRYLEVPDFFDLVTRIIFPSDSKGCLGGKSAGLFLARQILRRASQDEGLFDGIKTPRTWYLTADCLTEFLRFNELEDVHDLKYKQLEQVRIEYPNIIQLFKHARFPADISARLAQALDDFGDAPIIVRSSSLLEDRAGSAFSGKYKSLFLANRGSRQERLDALLDAIAEIYASVFGPDPILYRTEHGLLDFYEEMGIMVQEVVGTRVGPYLMPVFAGVAFSSNEFRWSPRLKREDGLIRMVPGLGTRAVDRIGNDYPVLLSPGQPALRVNASPEEMRHYSPSQVDVINLESGAFETVSIDRLLREYGPSIPNLHQMVSVYRDGHISCPSALSLDTSRDELLFTFDGLIARTEFVEQIRSMLLTLQQALGTPVDTEFASDGTSFYLLQCRPQYTEQNAPSIVRRDIPENETLFTAKRFISNGRVADITHIVYVSPQQYAQQTSLDAMVAIGQAVGRLNAILPKRRFILMGPGRWGSRGDIKQGVSVTYSDICNTAVLIEISLRKGLFEPELSFGTHFFQDMVEAGIRYIPLYPDEKEVVFNDYFLENAHNLLPVMLPEFAHLADVLRVIDIPDRVDGKILKIQMNAELCEAIGFFTEATAVSEDRPVAAEPAQPQSEDFWRWRTRMAERLARRLDPERFGVRAVYLFGSTASATAGPGSDIDLLIHFQGSPLQRQELLLWLEGWSLSLSEQNYLRTGYMTAGLLDAHIVTDEDIRARSSYAVKIGAITDPATLLPLADRDSDVGEGYSPV